MTDLNNIELTLSDRIDLLEKRLCETEQALAKTKTSIIKLKQQLEKQSHILSRVSCEQIEPRSMY